ncbi:MAG: PEP-CTERM sorting domain-containing protein [Burkholderiales bacterium]|nr:PEP-CTERM sorting domain-containing protein [Burkholderiales bacterium]
MHQISKWVGSVALVAGLGFAGAANATWTFKGSGANDTNGDPLAKTSYTPDAGFTGDPSLNISGVYARNGSGNVGFASGASWASKALTYYDPNGLGMSSDGNTAPNHAIDNNGNTEGILLSFGSSVVLSSIGIGYKSGDADISVFRYTGASAPASLPGSSVGSFVTDALGTANSGWDLVGNYANLAVDNTNPYNMINGCTNASGTAVCSSSSKGSSWWLITAYNTAFGTGANLTQGDDYFKVYAVAGSKCTAGGTACGSTTTTGGNVPEPGSLALVIAALTGTWAARRKSGRAAARHALAAA